MHQIEPWHCGGDGRDPVLRRRIADDLNRCMTDVVTYHNDVARTGQNLNETSLTPTTVTASTFGKTRSSPPDGKVDAQPLFLSGVLVPGVGIRDVVYVATEHDSVYAFDAIFRFRLWHVSLLGTGETTSDTRGCSQVTPEIGITSTPVIDRSRGPNGIVYVVAMSKTAAARMSSACTRSTPRSAASCSAARRPFRRPSRDRCRQFGGCRFRPQAIRGAGGPPRDNGQIVTAWTSHCDIDPYTGWIIAFDAGHADAVERAQRHPERIARRNVDGGRGPGGRRPGQCLRARRQRDVRHHAHGRGLSEQGDFGNAFLKIATAGGLSVADYFATFDTVSASNADTDLGSGGAMVFPDFVDASGHAPPRRRRRQGRPPLRRRPGRDGEVERVGPTRTTRTSAARSADRCSRCRPISTTLCTTAHRGRS